MDVVGLFLKYRFGVQDGDREAGAVDNDMPLAVKPCIEVAGLRRSRTLRSAASGSMPSDPRMISRGAAAAHACGEHDEGYGMGAARCVCVESLQRVRGGARSVNVDARRRSSAESAALW